MIELVITNIIFIVVIWIAEAGKWVNSLSTKYIKYDKIDLIQPEKREELIADLKKRTGLNIKEVSIGSIDFLKDMALVKVFYTDEDNKENDDTLQKMPKLYD